LRTRHYVFSIGGYLNFILVKQLDTLQLELKVME